MASHAGHDVGPGHDRGVDRRANATRRCWPSWPAAGCEVKHAALVEALTGRFDDHHAELARMLLDQIDAADRARSTGSPPASSELIAAIPAAQGADADGTTGPRRRPAARTPPVLPRHRPRLDEIPGIGRRGAQVIIAEIGLDMSRFPTAGHLVSWAKLSPRTIQSGASSRTGQHRQGQPLPQRRPRRGRRRRRPHRHLPRRTLPAHRQTPRQTQGPRRRRPLHPGHRLAPAGRPHRPLPRPRPRLPRQPHRHRPQSPQPHPTTRGPRLTPSPSPAAA